MTGASVLNIIPKEPNCLVQNFTDCKSFNWVHMYPVSGSLFRIIGFRHKPCFHNSASKNTSNSSLAGSLSRLLSDQCPTSWNPDDQLWNWSHLRNLVFLLVKERAMAFMQCEACKIPADLIRLPIDSFDPLALIVLAYLLFRNAAKFWFSKWPIPLFLIIGIKKECCLAETRQMFPFRSLFSTLLLPWEKENQVSPINFPQFNLAPI